MKKILAITLTIFACTTLFYAQTKSIKIGYVDMEFILKNAPDYLEAQNQLEQKAEGWKQEIETKKNEIKTLKEALQAEKALLTKGLIEERASEITFLENETLEYQQKRFGPTGDLITLKNSLAKPIQDQVFTAVQDIAETKKYDFIFDKTSDLTILFAAKRYDISDQIVRILTKTEKREQLTKKQLKEEEQKEAEEDAITENPGLAQRKQALEDKKTAREAAVAAKLQADAERRKALEDRKQQLLAEKAAKRTGNSVPGVDSATPNEENNETTSQAATDAKKLQADIKAEASRMRNQELEDRKKAVEERKSQILQKRTITNPTITATEISNTVTTPQGNATKNNLVEQVETAEAIKQKQIDARNKILEDRKKNAEEIKRQQEEKRKQLLEQSAAKKIGTVSDLTEQKNVNLPAKTVDSSNVPGESKQLSAAELLKRKQVEAIAKAAEERSKSVEARKQALEEKKKKILEAREADKKSN